MARNKYAGYCYCCGTFVPVGYGHFERRWGKDSPVSFKPDGHTVHDFDARFALEDEGIITPDDKWKWAYLADEPIQLKIR